MEPVTGTIAAAAALGIYVVAVTLIIVFTHHSEAKYNRW